MELLFRLSNPKEHGLKRLKVSLATCCSSASTVPQHLLPLLELLGSDELSAGSCRAPLIALLREIYRIPGLLACVREAVEQGDIADASPITWWLLQLAVESEDVRQDPAVREMVEPLKLHGGAAAERAAKNLVVVLAGTADDEQRQSAARSTLEDLQSGPGGRHDNDHADFRSIEVCPASGEALCMTLPYLPCVRDTPLLPSAEAHHLDRQFRLLREDMLQPLRQSIKELGYTAASSRTAGPSRAVPDLFSGFKGALAEALGAFPPGFAGGNAGTGAVPSGSLAPAQSSLAPVNVSAALQQRNVFAVMEVKGVALKPRPSLMLSLRLPMSHRAARMQDLKERQNFWKEFGGGTLPLDALVCLVPTAPVRGHQMPLVFATVSRRDVPEMSQAHPIFGLSFSSGKDADAAFQMIGCDL
ncbi:hypothetical protein FOA52_016295 [Chlamydomonas sp. UWO 241]|nr:hypothetical protein FOA52_016295 [Chlamydomonas sp. UWO 241]